MCDFLYMAIDALESVYYVAGIVVAVASIVGLGQLSLFKRDIQLRNQRAAKEQAIVYSTRFLTGFARLNQDYADELKARGISPYDGPIGDFSSSSIPTNDPHIVMRRLTADSWILAINELEAISSAFTSGVADESLGFEIIGRTYCTAVEARYDVIAACRTDSAIPQYQSIVHLYKTWRPRLTKADLVKKREALDGQIQAQGDSKIPPIGCQ